MLVARPTSLSGVFDALDELPGAHPLAGATDLMVDALRRDLARRLWPEGAR